MNVLDRAVGLLPEQQVGGRAELRVPHLEVHAEPVDRQPGGGGLARLVLGERAQVVAQQLAQPAHLGRALVLDAEGEGAARRLGVEPLELVV